MRVASYNLYEGAKGTIPLLKEFVEQADVDVLCIQEANGWNDGKPSQLEELAHDSGLTNFVYGDSNTRFKLATLSRLPIEESKVHAKGFWHCAIQASVGDVDIWNVHLDPQSEDNRLAEVQKIAGMVDPSRQSIITGDFNSLSSVDRYPAELAQLLAKQKISKFGVGRVRYDVTDYLGRRGFIDAAARLKSQASTVPTPANQDAFHAADMRLDYMFVNNGLIRAVSDVEVPKTDLTDVISDHYPIIMTLN